MGLRGSLLLTLTHSTALRGSKQERKKETDMEAEHRERVKSKAVG